MVDGDNQGRAERRRNWLSRMASRRAHRRRALWVWCALLAAPTMAVEAAFLNAFTHSRHSTAGWVAYLTPAGAGAMIGLLLLGLWALRQSERWHPSTDELLYGIASFILGLICLYSLFGALMLILTPLIGTLAFSWTHPILAMRALVLGPEHFTHRRARRLLLILAIPPIPLLPVFAFGAAAILTVPGMLVLISYGALFGYCWWTRRMEKRVVRVCGELGMKIPEELAEQLCLSYGWRFIDRLPLEEVSMAPGMSTLVATESLDALMHDVAGTYGMPWTEKTPWLHRSGRDFGPEVWRNVRPVKPPPETFTGMLNR